MHAGSRWAEARKMAQALAGATRFDDDLCVRVVVAGFH
jgi:hypothetical protein